jgi:hypothetical protein
MEKGQVMSWAGWSLREALSSTGRRIAIRMIDSAPDARAAYHADEADDFSA